MPNRAERRRAERQNKQLDLKELPKFVQQHQENMAAILVTSALSVLHDDFGFTTEQLSAFNEKMQKKAIAGIAEKVFDERG